MPYELFLALRYLRFHRGRTFLSLITLISVLGVAVGTAALVIALALMAGFVRDVRERIHSGSAHLTITSSETPTFGDGRALVQRVEAVEGVQAAGPVLYTPALITAEMSGEHGFAELQGIDPAEHVAVVPVDPHGEREVFLALARDGAQRAAIVLGEHLARRVGVGAGDTVRVVVPELTLAPWGPMPRSQLFDVVGTYRSEHFQQDSRRAYTDIESVRRLLRAPEASGWLEVRLDELGRLEPMKQRLREALGTKWLVIDLLEANADILRALRTERLILFMAIGLIVVVASLNIVSTLVLMVNDKTKEIGTLSAMGARASSVAAVFMLQGLVIGAVGSLCGVGLGFGISRWLDAWRILSVNPEIYYLEYIPFATQPLDLVWVGSAAFVVSFLATLYPALKAARLDPVEALRHE